jgi:hypothetical protein
MGMLAHPSRLTGGPLLAAFSDPRPLRLTPASANASSCAIVTSMPAATVSAASTKLKTAAYLTNRPHMPLSGSLLPMSG